jgi:hypothetical protein
MILERLHRQASNRRWCQILPECYPLLPPACHCAAPFSEQPAARHQILVAEQGDRRGAPPPPAPNQFGTPMVVFSILHVLPRSCKPYLVSVKTSGVEIGSKRWSVDCHAALVLHGGSTRWWRPGHRRQDLAHRQRR